MLSPTHPLRFFVSYNGRKMIRSVQDRLHVHGFAQKKSHQPLPISIKDESSPIFRNFKHVRKELFINKITNLRLAIEKMNGILIQPGETFSFWNLVGKPSTQKGYLPGLVIERGKPSEGIGGGLCQLANMIHWLALHSLLEITERHRHSFDVFPDDHRKIPFATGATIVYSYKDLRLLNNTKQTYQLNFALTEEALTGYLSGECEQHKSFRVEERNHTFITMPDGLYRQNQVYQLITDKVSGKTDETLVFNNRCKCNYSMEDISL